MSDFAESATVKSLFGFISAFCISKLTLPVAKIQFIDKSISTDRIQNVLNNFFIIHHNKKYFKFILIFFTSFDIIIKSFGEMSELAEGA